MLVAAPVFLEVGAGERPTVVSDDGVENVHILFRQGQNVFHVHRHYLALTQPRRLPLPLLTASEAIGDLVGLARDQTGALHAAAIVQNRVRHAFSAWYTRSDDGGRSWHEPVLVCRGRGSPSVARVAASTTWIHVLICNPRGARARAVLHACSADGGVSWRVAKPVRSRTVAVAVDGEGRLQAAIRRRARRRRDVGEFRVAHWCWDAGWERPELIPARATTTGDVHLAVAGSHVGILSAEWVKTAGRPTLVGRCYVREAVGGPWLAETAIPDWHWPIGPLGLGWHAGRQTFMAVNGNQAFVRRRTRWGEGDEGWDHVGAFFPAKVDHVSMGHGRWAHVAFTAFGTIYHAMLTPDD